MLWLLINTSPRNYRNLSKTYTVIKRTCKWCSKFKFSTLHRKAIKKKLSLWIKRWSTDVSFSFLITGRFRNKYSAISKMIPHSLDLSPSRSLQLAKYAKCSWISWNWDTVLVYTGPDKFLNGQKLAQIRLSFTRDLRNLATFWKAKCASSWPDQKMVPTRVNTWTGQVFAQFARKKPGA